MPSAIDENLLEQRRGIDWATFQWQPSLHFLPYDCIGEERKARTRR